MIKTLTINKNINMNGNIIVPCRFLMVHEISNRLCSLGSFLTATQQRYSLLKDTTSSRLDSLGKHLAKTKRFETDVAKMDTWLSDSELVAYAPVVLKCPLEHMKEQREQFQVSGFFLNFLVSLFFLKAKVYLWFLEPFDCYNPI